MRQTMLLFFIVNLASYSSSLPFENSTKNDNVTSLLNSINDLVTTVSTTIDFTSPKPEILINETLNMSTTTISPISNSSMTTLLPFPMNSSQNILSPPDRMKSEDHEELSSVDTFARLTGLLYETETDLTSTSIPSTTKFSKTMKTNLHIKNKDSTTESNRLRMSIGTTTLPPIRSTTERSSPFSRLKDLSLDDSQEFEQGEESSLN